MSKSRKGKLERLAERAKYSAFREYRSELVIRNNDAISHGLVPEPDKFATLGDLGRFGARARVSQLIVSKDPARQRQLNAHKFRVQDSDLYTEKPAGSGGERGEVLVRVGTTPARGLMIEKDGERKFVRIPEQPKFAPVGKPGSIPKDGGK